MNTARTLMYQKSTSEMVLTVLSKRFLSGNAKSKHFKLVIVGGGSGGCSIAAKFARKIDPNSIAVVEPADMHYYQPMWTLVGGGMKTLQESGKKMESVLPKNITWIKDKAVEFHPDKNFIKVNGNHQDRIQYDYLVVAMGIQLKYNQIKGLPEGFETPGVCSNYSPLYVNKTFEALKGFKKGNAIFTFPNTPIKCAGAPQKILYIADSYFRKMGKRQGANMIFNSSLGVLFGVKKYADALWEIVNKRDITVNLRRNLVEVVPKERKAIFENLDSPGRTHTFDYEMLHITPPQSPHDVLKNAGDLVDPAGYVNLNKGTLQHVKYQNVFGIGDCSNLPTSKTAAAVAGQCGVLSQNLWNVMQGKEPGKRLYDGYTSCPLVTSYSTCILAEFDYNSQPLETFPINQARESRVAFHMKKDVMPKLYWKLMLNGYWNGPSTIRKIAHFGMK